MKEIDVTHKFEHVEFILVIIVYHITFDVNCVF